MTIHELLADALSWTQHTYARDAHGSACDPHGGDAVCWCLAGALLRCYTGGHRELVSRQLLQAIGIPVTPAWESRLSAWNDTHDFAAVQALVQALHV